MASGYLGKTVTKGSSKMSLNDRFQLLRQKTQRAAQLNASNNAMNRTIVGRRLVKQGSAKNRRLALQMANRPAVMAALKRTPQNLSVKQRLGFRPQNRNRNMTAQAANRTRLTGRRPINKSAPGKINRAALMNVRRRRGAFNAGGNQMVVNRQPQGNRNLRGGRGRLAPTRGGFRRRGRGQAQNQGQARGGQQKRGFRINRNFNARGNQQRRGKPNREQLDNDLDKYMAKTKNHLDMDLDAYMSQT